MPVNMWNFFRAVGTGSDHKSWLSENPQVLKTNNSDKILTIIIYRLRMAGLEAIWYLIRKYEINIQMK